MNSKPPFLYSLNASTIRPTPLLKKIAVTAKAGYTGIELWHEEIDAFLRQGGSVTELRSALGDHGLKVPTTIYLRGWFETEGEAHTRTLEECLRRMKQAAELGAPFVIASPPAGKAEVALGATHYRELFELGRSTGVKPAMEFLGFVQELNTIESALEVMTRSGQREATIVLDPFHVFRGGGSMESIARLRADQIAISHFNDAPAQPPRHLQHDKDRVLPGEGCLDLRRYVALLRQIGYQGWLSLELFNEALWAQDPFEVARIGLEKMRSLAEA